MPKTGRPPKADWACCKVEGCVKEARGAKGFCQSHYVAFTRGTYALDGTRLVAPRRVSSYGAGARCAVEGCLNRPKGRGLCAGHYQQWNDGLLPIDVPNRSVQKDQYRYGDEAVCAVGGCTLRPINKFMCSKHAQQRERGILDEQGNQLRPLLALGRKPKEGPIYDGAGYVLVRPSPGYPGKTRQGRVLEHRLVMEQHLGRLLLEHEIIHHKNGNRQDNRLDNLEIMTTKEHPPAHEYTPEQAVRALEALKHNDPDAYYRLLAGKVQ